MDCTYSALTARWKALRGTSDVRVREVACVGAARTLLCAELGDHRLPAIALSAGVHGDEPAGPWALLELVETRALDDRFAYRIWPCMNPTGFTAGTRENADGLDVNRTFGRGGASPEAKAILTANRDRKFVLSIDLHEDHDACGFYCYEYGGADLGSCAVEALREAGMPIDPLDATFALAGPIGEDQCRREPGRIVPDASAEAALFGGLSYSMAVVRNAARLALTFETPSALAWEVRVAMHVRAVRATISASGFASGGV